MCETRRRILQFGAGALCGSLLAPVVKGTDAGGGASRPRCLDYGRSFICHPGPENAVRFWVESRTTIIDPKNNTSTDYYQCGSCKSENTFAEHDLFKADNYDFLPVFGPEHALVFRRHAGLSPNYRQVHKHRPPWASPQLRLCEAVPVTLLDTWEKVHAATAAGLPIVTQTEIVDAATGLHAVIECPTKTMNISLPHKSYQVDTGPIAFADLSKAYNPQIDCLRLAFIAFNAPDFADFVVEQPTPVVKEDKELCKVYHYSQPFSSPAKNNLFALGILP